MSWCPKCKNEYREGFTVCSDCGCTLVEDLKDCEEKQPLFTTESKTAKELIQILDNSNINSHEFHITEEGQYVLFVAKCDMEDAEELIRNYQITHAEEEAENVTEDEKADDNLQSLQYEPSSIYVPQADKYNDFKFSGISFLVFTVLGYGLVIANKLGYISILTTFSTWVMIGVFTLFGVIGASTLMKAKTIKKNIGTEEKTTIAIRDWMTVHFSGDFIESCNDSDLPEDENYFIVMEQLMAKLAEAFPDANTSYLEQLADQFYSDYLEN